MRLLPQNEQLGWTPYAWLIYLASLPIYLTLSHAEGMQWVQAGALVVVFLPLYFRGYWLQGTALLPITAAISALGFFGVFVNPGASVFWVYAAAFLGRTARPRRAFAYLVALITLVAFEAWIFRLHGSIWIPGTVFSLLIGSINIHYDEVGRKNNELRLAHDEVRRLARTAERERIARDLHDVLGHTLSVIVLKSELASRLADRDPEQAIREIRDVESISRKALGEVREAVEGYRKRPRSLSDEFANACEVLASAGVEIAVERDEIPDDLSASEESVLALALREGVTNVVRHSLAKSCRIGLIFGERETRLELADDGRGSESPEGFGLTGMRERVEALGGELVRSSLAGTRLVVTIPTSEARA